MYSGLFQKKKYGVFDGTFIYLKFNYSLGPPKIKLSVSPTTHISFFLEAPF